jgi:hypothetical protein
MRDNETTAPGSHIGGQGEMGAPLEDGPRFVPIDNEGNVTGAGTDDVLGTSDQDQGGGSAGTGTGGYAGGGPREGGGEDSYSTDTEGDEPTAER